MSNTREFFKEKRDWSIFKDDLLKNYLIPYFAKLLATRRDIIFIDGFAGKGKFEDGTNGSPLIVATRIHPYFIDYLYANELKKNLQDKSMSVVAGDYRIEVPKILSGAHNKNIFLYVDPFGIKYLDFSIFTNLPSAQANSYELLLNLNSFLFFH